jgi:hypothetical protein
MTHYSDDFLNYVWAKTTRPLAGLSTLGHPSDACTDELGNVIYRSRYGKAHLPHSWKIDHRHPVALGGAHHASNLRALGCSTNRGLGGLLGNALR